MVAARHRYLEPYWWVRRTLPAASRILPPSATTAILAVSTRLWREKELRHLSGHVPADRVAIDVGAAQGVYTWHLARLARECVAFEPQPDLATKLRVAIPGATVHNCALSDAEGVATLRIPRQGKTLYRGYATIDPKNPLEAASDFDAIEVEVRTLDSFDIRDVGFMKIDVEGHELAVLRGARKTLVRDKPVLLIEIEDRHHPRSLESTVAWLGELGYRRLDVSYSRQNFMFVAGN
jgi:FkbM family methyltransferase